MKSVPLQSWLVEASATWCKGLGAITSGDEWVAAKQARGEDAAGADRQGKRDGWERRGRDRMLVVPEVAQGTGLWCLYGSREVGKAVEKKAVTLLCPLPLVCWALDSQWDP